MKEFLYTFHVRDRGVNAVVTVTAGYLEQAEDKLHETRPQAIPFAVVREPLRERQVPLWP